MIPVALSIAGSDPSGGAGIQGDLKTFHQHRVYGCAVPALLTVQNTCGVEHVEVLDAGLVAAQLDALLGDMSIAAAKTGALGSRAIVEIVAARFAAMPGVPLVVDPVLAATRGGALLDDAGRRALVTQLLPRAHLVTPNLPEAAILTGRTVVTEADAREAARALVDLGARAVLVKGGHLADEPVDVLHLEGRFERFGGVRVPGRTVHGLGCALSAAIASWLARGASLIDACARAKRWVHAGLVSAPRLGAGAGPIDHHVPVPDE